MAALDFITKPSHEVVVTATPDTEETREILKALGERSLPSKVVLFVPDGGALEVAEVASYAEEYQGIGGKATAYHCVNFNCQLLVTSVSQMIKLLERSCACEVLEAEIAVRDG